MVRLHLLASMVIATAGSLVSVALPVQAQQAPASSFAGPPSTYDDSSYQAWVSRNVNVRVGGGTQYQRFDTIRQGEYVLVQGCDRSWCYVQYEGGVGYISKRYISMGASPYNTDPIIGPAGPGIPPQEPGTYDPPMVRID